MNTHGELSDWVDDLGSQIVVEAIKEALKSMSPRTAKAAEFLGWQEICLSENLGVLR